MSGNESAREELRALAEQAHYYGGTEQELADGITALLDDLDAAERERDDWRRVAAEQTRMERDRAERAEAQAAALAEDFARRAAVYEAHPERDTDRYLDGVAVAMRVAEACARAALDTPADTPTEPGDVCACSTPPETHSVGLHAPTEPDADEREALARLIYEASDFWHEDGVAYENNYASQKREAQRQADALLAAGYRRTTGADS